MRRVLRDNFASSFARQNSRHVLAILFPAYTAIKRDRSINMPNGNSKADLQDQIDQAIDVLDDAYAPESTREDLAAAIGSALDILRGESNDSDDSDDQD
jgi:hypothetical protein